MWMCFNGSHTFIPTGEINERSIVNPDPWSHKNSPILLTAVIHRGNIRARGSEGQNTTPHALAKRVSHLWWSSRHSRLLQVREPCDIEQPTLPVGPYMFYTQNWFWEHLVSCDYLSFFHQFLVIPCRHWVLIILKRQFLKFKRCII